MVVKKKTVKVKAATKKVAPRKIQADDELMVEDEMMEEEAPVEEEPIVEVDPEATELVFEAEDVAELIANITEQEVEVTVDDDAVVFAVGDEEYTVQPDGDEEILEASKKVLKGKKAVSASKRISAKRTGRPVRRA